MTQVPANSPQSDRSMGPTPRPVQAPSPSHTSKVASTQPNSTVQSVLRPVDATTMSNAKKKPKGPKAVMLGVIALVVLVLGVGSGYVLAVVQSGNSVAGLGALSGDKNLKREVSSDEITVGTKVGIADESTFKDSSEGKLEKGGIEGEGSHHIVRPGGEDQTLYITSSVIDLDQFIDRKVKVWGETLGAQKAGWLMDVGKLEVLE